MTREAYFSKTIVELYNLGKMPDDLRHALDQVQKKLPIPDDKAKALRHAKLIKGRKPNLYVSAYVAAATSSQAAYLKTRPLDDKYYKSLIIDYLKEFKQASRQEIVDFLIPKLSELLTERQKQAKLSNLLSNLRRSGDILNTGSRSKPCWKIAERK